MEMEWDAMQCNGMGRCPSHLIPFHAIPPMSSQRGETTILLYLIIYIINTDWHWCILSGHTDRLNDRLNTNGQCQYHVWVRQWLGDGNDYDSKEFMYIYGGNYWFGFLLFLLLWLAICFAIQAISATVRKLILENLIESTIPRITNMVTAELWLTT